MAANQQKLLAQFNDVLDMRIFGGKELRDVTQADLIKAAEEDEKAAKGREIYLSRNRPDISPNGVQRMLITLTGILRCAVRHH